MLLTRVGLPIVYQASVIKRKQDSSVLNKSVDRFEPVFGAFFKKKVIDPNRPIDPRQHKFFTVLNQFAPNTRIDLKQVESIPKKLPNEDLKGPDWFYVPISAYMQPLGELTNQLMTDRVKAIAFLRALRDVHYKWDEYTDAARSNPFLAEMFLLLSSNKSPIEENNRTFTNAVSDAVGSINHYYWQHQIQDFINPDNVRLLWKDIGQKTHDFSRYTFDTIRLFGKEQKESLLEKYGFVRIEHDNEKLFGPGYFITNFQKPESGIDTNTTIELRRGYTLVSNKNYGTLLIRNSSPVFGRDLLVYPAYYSKENITSGQLKSFDIYEKIKGHSFHRILAPHFYRSEKYVNNMLFLMGELKKLTDDYRHWKLDTRSIIEGTLKGSFKGYQQKGFEWFIRMAYYAAYYNEQHSLPPLQIALVNAKKPIWTHQPYAIFDLNRAHQDQLIAFLKAPNDFASLSSDLKNFLVEVIRHGKYAEVVLREKRDL